MVVLRRRRHKERWLVPAVPMAGALTIAAALLLLILACHTLLASPVFDMDHSHHHNLLLQKPPLHRHRYKPSAILSKNPEELQQKKAVGAADVFLVTAGEESPAKDLWASALSKNYHGCSNASSEFASAEDITLPNRYLMIATSGGLNQQRTGITDAVVAARILNATLVVPKLDEKSFWKDESDFSEIFDVDWFISSLANDVKIIKNLPKKVKNIVGAPYNIRVPRKCNPRCYESRVLPALQKKHVVQLTKFDYRLANKLEADYQKLRCRVNYHALRFTDQIQAMGDMLIQRMKAKNSHFIALHLRFEPDMLAFSGCYYGGGEKETKELGTIRKRWKSLKTSNPEKERRHGKCPLTPEEVGLMLRALGFGTDVHIYVASGDVYGGEQTLAPLKALFPNYHSKETLTTKEELASFSSFSSRMAALDFIVCDGSDVFVTNNNGNMARMLAGRRRYFGHKRTIRPNAKKLYSLFLNRTGMTWETFSSKVHTFQKGFMGEPNEVKPGRGEFHENPESCICENTKMTVKPNSELWSEAENDKGKDKIGTTSELKEYQSTNDNFDWTDLDYGENTPLDIALSNETKLEDYIFINPDEPELEEIISE